MQQSAFRSAAAIRRSNSFAVVRALHAQSTASRRDLAATTGLSFATIATICNELIEQGVVIEVARTRAESGRPAATLALNRDHGILLGVDIAETYVEVSAFDGALELLSTARHPLRDESRDPEQVVAELVEALHEELAAHPQRVLGIGVAAPGQVSLDGDTTVFAPNWGWHDVPLLDLLTGHVDAPVLLDNPLKALVIAELWLATERAAQSFAVINLGTGVGAGLALGGGVFRGPSNSAGEWGHTTIDLDGRRCRCGASGCVEAYLGAPGIVQTLREHAPESDMLREGDQTATLSAIAAAVRAGDPVAVQVVEETARYAGRALGSLVNMVNPDVLVLRGWVADLLGDELIERLTPHIGEQALAVPLGVVRLERATSELNAVALGMATVALEAHLDALGSGTPVVVPAEARERRRATVSA